MTWNLVTALHTIQIDEAPGTTVIVVVARLAGDATELLQSHRWMAVPAAATLGRQQMAALSG